MAKTSRTAAVRLFLQGLPTAAAAVTTALLAPFGAWSAAGLAAFVGAGAWAGMMRRRSTLLPVSERFIGS